MVGGAMEMLVVVVVLWRGCTGLWVCVGGAGCEEHFRRGGGWWRERETADGGGVRVEEEGIGEGDDWFGGFC